MKAKLPKRKTATSPDRATTAEMIVQNLEEAMIQIGRSAAILVQATEVRARRMM
jgi:hypothetical protein